MNTQFWPALRVLADIFSAQGLTADERLGAVVEKFRELPPIVQRQILSDAFQLAMELPDVYTGIVAEANRAEEPQDGLSAG